MTFENILVLAILAGAVVLFVEIINWLMTGTLQKTKKKVPSDLLRLITSIVLYSVFILLVLRFVYEQDISALLATSAVLSVALGLALREPLGHETLIYVGTAAGEVIAKADGRTPPEVGEAVRLGALPENMHVFDAKTGEALA